MASCQRCGTVAPTGTRFCPHCGLAVGGSGTAVLELPPEETGRVPVNFMQTQRHLFGVTPPMALFALAFAALALGVLLTVLGHYVAGPVLIAVGLILFGLFMEVARRLPSNRMTQASVEALDSLRARAGVAAVALATRSSVRRELRQIQRDLGQMQRVREALLRDLGEATFRGDDAASAAIADHIRELDGLAAAAAKRMESVAIGAAQRVERAQLAVQSTEIAVPAARDDEPNEN